MKPKTCKVCGAGFIPLRAMASVCSPMCALKKVRADKAQGKRELRARKEAIKTAKDCKKAAQAAFNKWVRARDAHLPCVSCGETNPPMKPGGQWDAGHFLSRGAYPEKAFIPDNCWKQCKSCNGGAGRFSRKARTVSQAYEEELLRRIGPERLAAVKAPTPQLHYSADDYKAIEAEYKAKLKELEREAND